MAGISIVSIRRDGGTQPRATTHVDWIEEYANDMVEGAKFPPVVVFFDGTEYWLADGFHRTAAAEAAGFVDIEADVRQGTQRDAVLFSVGANAGHGHRRTNEDKRRAVLRLLDDSEWITWSNSEIARRCGVDEKTVRNLKPNTSELPKYEPRTFIHPKTGQPTTMNTGNIGRGQPVRPTPPANRDTWSPPAADLPSDPVPTTVIPEAITASTQPQPKFDHEAAAVRSKAMGAIRALAEQPEPQVVIDAWMKSDGYGEPAEKIERAITWLQEFLEIYRVVEPARWNAVQERIRRVA